MSKVGLWSTTAGNNNSAPPDGWPEGQAPSTVNDCARENMAAVRTAMQDMDFFDHAFSPTFINVDSFSVPGDQTARLNSGRKLKLFDASTHVRPIGSASFTTVTTVSLGPGTALTSSLTSFAVSIINPALNALPNSQFRRNLIINGDMTVWQRGNDFSSSAGTNRLADNFMAAKNLSAGVDIHHLSIGTNPAYAPSIGAAGTLFTDSLQFSVISADAAIATGQYLTLETFVEGYDWRHATLSDMHLSFYVQTAQTGTYCVSMRNNGSSVSYVQNYTVTTSGWQKINLAIPPAPTSPYTWDYSTGTGLAVRFCLAAGTTFQAASAGNWTAGNFLATSSQFNFASSAGHSIVFTGIQLEKGTAPTPFEEVSVAVKNSQCSRYYQLLPDNLGGQFNYHGYARANNVVVSTVFFSQMRSAPTVSYPAAANIRVADFAGTEFSCVSGTTDRISTKSIDLLVTSVGTPFVPGDGASVKVVAGSAIALKCELI